MAYEHLKPLPDDQLFRVSGGGVLMTDAPKIGILNEAKKDYCDLANFGNVSHRSFYLCMDAYIVLPVGSKFTFCMLSTEVPFFEFDLLP